VALRPKHHFVQEIPGLMLEFGPLIKVWTMRYESKHKLFKKIVRSSQNFINVLKTMSEKHEYFQSFQRAGANYKPEVVINFESPFFPELYNADIQSSISVYQGSVFTQCESISVKNTT